MDEVMIPVSEIFYSVQGEGPFIGQPAVFFRVEGCVCQCEYCDSKYTWKPKHFRSISDISKKITSLLQQHNCNRVVITGGEPLLYCNELVKLCFRYLQHCKFEVETSGTQFPLSLLSDRVWYNVSPKPPSAHSKCEYSPQILKFFNSVKNSTFKFVVQDESDFEWVLSVVSECSINTDKVMVMPEGTTTEEILPRLKWLVPLSLKYGFGVTPRLQILVWGNQRGV